MNEKVCLLNCHKRKRWHLWCYIAIKNNNKKKLRWLLVLFLLPYILRGNWRDVIIRASQRPNDNKELRLARDARLYPRAFYQLKIEHQLIARLTEHWVCGELSLNRLRRRWCWLPLSIHKMALSGFLWWPITAILARSSQNTSGWEVY